MQQQKVMDNMWVLWVLETKVNQLGFPAWSEDMVPSRSDVSSESQMAIMYTEKLPMSFRRVSDAGTSNSIDLRYPPHSSRRVSDGFPMPVRQTLLI